MKNTLAECEQPYFFTCTQPEACQITAEEAHTCLHLSSIASKLSKLEFLI